MDLKEITKKPIVEGKSKHLYDLDNDNYLIKLIPSLSSFTHNRYENVDGSEVLRMDFYELAANILENKGIKTSFVKRIDERTYVSKKCSDPPFEVIVKNIAVGSTVRKYPNLFPMGHRFKNPVVKFDYRIDPEDQPIAEDYLDEFGYNSKKCKEIALRVNECLSEWLAPLELHDFCLVLGTDENGQYFITSEISPDCMRLKSKDGMSCDKDLFRQGESKDKILEIWTSLINTLRKNRG